MPAVAPGLCAVEPVAAVTKAGGVVLLCSGSGVDELVELDRQGRFVTVRP